MRERIYVCMSFLAAALAFSPAAMAKVATFAVDGNTGKLTPGPKADVPQAACINFAML